MTTCADWAERLAALKAAELKYLTGDKVHTTQDGAMRITKSEIDLAALKTQITIAQSHVDACSGRSRARAVTFVPVDR